MRGFLRSRTLSGGVLFFFLFFLSVDIVPQGDQGKLSFAELLDQGKKLYAEKDYENAVIRLLQARPLAATDAEIIEINFVLSRVYFDIDERDAARSCMRKMLELSPEKFSDEKTVSSGWRKLFQEVKRASEDDSPQIAGMRFREELKKKKKLNRFEIFGALALLVGFVVVLIITTKKSKKIETDSDYDTREMKIEWVTVPTGEFQMGDIDGEGKTDERPAHTVYLDRYEISKFEITYDQFDLYCRETNRAVLVNARESMRGSRPVLIDTWDDASSFCTWLALKTGRKIHLPTEAQWEKAARGTDERKYPWGNVEPNCSLANFNNCVSATQPVGSYPAGGSPYGVMDMAGNAMEWTGDRYSSSYVSTGTSIYLNPSFPVYAGSSAVVRGGDWKSGAFSIQTLRRSNYPLATSGIGFRICKE